MFRIAMGVLVACGLAAGCKKDEPPPPPPADNTAEPAADGTAAAKEAARLRLRTVIRAWHEYHDWANSFPANAAPKAGVGLSWRVMLLPSLGPKERDLFGKFKLDEPWDSEANKKLIDQMPDVFASAGKPAGEGMTYLRSFVGPHAVTPVQPRLVGPTPRSRRMADLTDGTMNTLAIAEAAEPVIWTKADELAFDGGPDRPTAAVPKLGGPFADGFHAGMADGAVRWFDKAVPEATVRAVLTIDGGESVTLPPAWTPPAPPPGPAAPSRPPPPKPVSKM